MKGYDLTRTWYNYKFQNQDKVRSIHSELYFYIVDLWNRLGQKKQFGLPTLVTMQTIGIGSYNTYKKVLCELVDFGFIKVVSDAKNQYQSKIIALSNNDKATDKALDKAHNKATDEAPDEALDSIDKQLTTNNKKLTNIISFFEGSDEIEIDFYYKVLVAEKKKKEKVAPKEKETTEHWKVYTESWFMFYKSKIGFDPTFEGKESAALKSIAKKLKAQSESKSILVWDADYVKRVFEHFLTKAYADKWRRENFMLHILNSHFDAIIQTDENRTDNNKQSKQGISLESTFAKIDGMYSARDGQT